MLIRWRIVQLVRAIQRRMARTSLNKRYAARFAQVDAKAELFSITFVGKNRDLFNRLAEFHAPTVGERGKYLLDARYKCHAVVAMLLMRDLMRRHAVELEKVDPVQAKKLARVTEKFQDQTERYLAGLKRADFPIKLIVTEYDKSIIRTVEIN